MKEGRVQVIPQCLDIRLLYFSVDRNSHESPYVEPTLNEVPGLSQGISNAQRWLGHLPFPGPV
jgi:hypothetical protein